MRVSTFIECRSWCAVASDGPDDRSGNVLGVAETKGLIAHRKSLSPVSSSPISKRSWIHMADTVLKLRSFEHTKVFVCLEYVNRTASAAYR